MFYVALKANIDPVLHYIITLLQASSIEYSLTPDDLCCCRCGVRLQPADTASRGDVRGLTI